MYDAAFCKASGTSPKWERIPCLRERGNACEAHSQDWLCHGEGALKCAPTQATEKTDVGSGHGFILSIALRAGRSAVELGVTRCGVHWFILIVDWAGGYTPHPMHECQNKGDIKWAICKCMKRKSDDFLGETKRAFPSTALGMNHNGNCWYTPAVFVRVASKGVTGYGK